MGKKSIIRQQILKLAYECALAEFNRMNNQQKAIYLMNFEKKLEEDPEFRDFYEKNKDIEFI